MSSGKRRLAITGFTGLLGRNLLFEILRNYLPRLHELEIFVFGRRDTSGSPLRDRLRHILLDDGAAYLGVDGQAADSLMTSVITCVEMDFDSESGRIGQDAMATLQSAPLDWFFHVAALTDLRSTQAAWDDLRRTNIEGTRRVMELVSALRVNEFCYVGTAYACGIAAGRVQPDSLNPAGRFRNHYERSKAGAETLVRDFAGRTGLRCRYFRPATICGRLLEPPFGAVCSFDVFYAWAAFFFRLRMKRAGAVREDRPCELNLRVCYSRRSGLNIVPVDYVARVIYLICEHNDPGESYHLANTVETPHAFYIPRMLQAVGVSGVTRVDRVPDDKNSLEELYYKSVGALYTPYITCEPMCFDTENLRHLSNRFGLSCPKLDEEALGVLMGYARDRNFGLKLRR